MNIQVAYIYITDSSYFWEL